MTTQPQTFDTVLPEVASVDDVDWDDVYRRELPRILNFFRYKTGDRGLAEDLASLTFEKAWRGRSGYRHDVAGFSTWLFTIARNVAIDHFRRRKIEVPLEDKHDPPSSTTPEDAALKRADCERLAVLLATLPDRERELVALKYGAELTNRAIAGITGLSETNVGTILHRTVQALRSRWTPEETIS
jgi:RNA polymerase sigma-70 factor (ECF subfamily)